MIIDLDIILFNMTSIFILVIMKQGASVHDVACTPTIVPKLFFAGFEFGSVM